MLLGIDVVSLGTPELLMGLNFLRNPVISGCLDFYGLQIISHPGTSDYQPSMDSRLLGIRGLQTTRHPGTSDYQAFGDFRLPVLYGLQATRHPGTSDY